jgi:hypothetical protein
MPFMQLKKVVKALNKFDSFAKEMGKLNETERKEVFEILKRRNGGKTYGES